MEAQDCTVTVVRRCLCGHKTPPERFLDQNGINYRRVAVKSHRGALLVRELIAGRDIIINTPMVFVGSEPVYGPDWSEILPLWGK
jgi:glutaredoxin